MKKNCEIRMKTKIKNPHVISLLIFLSILIRPASAQTNGEAHEIDLPTALRLAGAQNLDVQIARERLAEARANHESTVWQFFPWVAPGVAYRRHDGFIQNIEGRILDVQRDSYTAGPTIMAQLDVGDAIYKNLAAKQLVRASEHAVASVRLDSVLAAALGYFDLARAEASAEVARDAVRISTNYFNQLQQAVAAGLVFKGDLLRVQAQSEKNRLTKRQTLEARRAASARLSQVLHLDPTIVLVPADTTLAPIELVATNVPLNSLVKQALAARPELKQGVAQIAAARDARAGALYGPLVPSVGAQVFAGGFGGGKDGTARVFGESEDYVVTLGWRLGPGGLFDKSRKNAAQSRLTTARLLQEKLSEDIVRQVVEAQTKAIYGAEQLVIARRGLAAADEAFHLTRERKEYGVGAVLENIQAEQDFIRARLDYLNVIAESNKAQFLLSRAIGKLE